MLFIVISICVTSYLFKCVLNLIELEIVMEQFGVLTLGSRLKRLSDYLFAQVQEVYVECDIPISATYFPILKLLQTVGDLSVVEIAERLHLSHPAVSKQTTKMIKASLLKKTVDEQDQRRSSLALSGLGVDAMLRVEPILQELQFVLEQQVDFSSQNFMDSLSLLEVQVFNGRIANKVMDRLSPVDIVLMEKQHEQAFYDLNMAWLERYFPNQIEDEDRALLTDPQYNIVTMGGSVWVALSNAPAKSIIGTIAFLPQNKLATSGSSVGSVLKLSVAEHARGKGVAQRLLSTVIDFAKNAGFSALTLETASCLKSARQLYDKNAFVEMPSPNKSHYQRADVYMVKPLRDVL